MNRQHKPDRDPYQEKLVWAFLDQWKGVSHRKVARETPFNREQIRMWRKGGWSWIAGDTAVALKRYLGEPPSESGSSPADGPELVED